MSSTATLIRDLRPAVYAVAGGNHVTIVLDREATAGAFDVTEVTALPGGGPPPHRHSFAEWFRVLEGELTLIEAYDGLAHTRVLGAGDDAFVTPWTVHSTLNLGTETCRFEVTSAPGAMSGYVKEAGIPVADALTAPSRRPPGPDELREVGWRWGIQFAPRSHRA
jgi:quercetin dioxygenase-like cupin family protein